MVVGGGGFYEYISFLVTLSDAFHLLGGGEGGGGGRGREGEGEGRGRGKGGGGGAKDR
jgi:hypothetical protein